MASKHPGSAHPVLARWWASGPEPPLSASDRRLMGVHAEDARSLAGTDSDSDSPHDNGGGGDDASESLPPFLGVPISIKECFAMQGMPHTSGLLARVETQAPQEDATAVRRLRAAGFVCVATTNVSELCMWYESANPVWGRTNNPYAVSHIVGGSSGGEAALIAACGSPCGLGSDVGGSIRMPAFFNGVAGHKPTGGRVPATGQHPVAEGDALRYLTTGPIARYAEDLWPLLVVIEGADGVDTACRGQWPTTPMLRRSATPAALLRRGLPGVRVVVPVGASGKPDDPMPLPPLVTPVADDLAGAMAAAYTVLRDDYGCACGHIAMPEFARSLDMWSAKLALAEQPSFRDHLSEGAGQGGVRIGLEIVKGLFGRSRYTLPALVLAAVEKLPAKLAPRHTRAAAAAADALRERLARELGPHGVMLFPSHSTVAPVHNAPLLRPFNFTFTSLFNALELPVTQVPLGLNAAGLPMGLQVVGAPGCDHVTIAVALALERSMGGWVPPELA